MTNCSPTRRSADLRRPHHGGADGGGLTQGRVTVTAKICGINDARAMQAAAAGGASHVGMVFYPPSPRAVTPAVAADLAVHAGNAQKVGLRSEEHTSELQSLMRISSAVFFLK